MDHIRSIQLEDKMVQYRDGLITDTEMRRYCLEAGGMTVGPEKRERYAPSEACTLKHEMRFLRKRMAKARRLHAMRTRVQAQRNLTETLERNLERPDF
jgi:hypothetical protein